MSKNCFPVPITCTRENVVGNSITLMSFESVPRKKLYGLRGPVLATFLRKYPSIVIAWCLQLSALIQSLRSCSGKLLQALNPVRDVFIRENGLLLFGNVAFSSGCDGGESVSDTHSLLKFSHSILSEALGVSRRVDIDIGTPGYARFDGEYVSKVHQSYENAHTEMTDRSIVLHVVAGSSLSIAVKGTQEVSRVRMVKKQEWEKTTTEIDSTELGTLTVHVADESVDVADVRCSMVSVPLTKKSSRKTTPSAVVNLKATEPGVVSLTFTLPATT